MFEVSPPY